MCNRWGRPGPRPAFFLFPLLIGLWMVSASIFVFGQRSRIGEVYGGIEISPAGFRGVAIRLTEGEEGYRVIYAENITATLTSLNNQLLPDLIRDSVQAVYQIHTRMKTDYKVPENNIFIIGSSRLRSDNPQNMVPDLMSALTKGIKERVGKTPILLDLDTETQLSIIGTIPPHFRGKAGSPDNRSDAMLVDIGPDTLRGGYQVIRQNNSDKLDYDYVTFNVATGLTIVTNEINQLTAKDGSLTAYMAAAKGVCANAVGASLRDEIERKPGLVNRQQIYLSGGIVHAMMTLLRPDDRRLYVRIFDGEIDIFYRTLTGDPDILQRMLFPDLTRSVPNPALRKEIEKQVESVRNAYSLKDLIAGAEFLKTLSAELKFSGKTVRYARIGYLSSILGYVRAQTTF
ncbi:MAG TPA: hypothetical protein VJ302_35535 [Blastocatellia bacterium]|nr:hypothetical protein [Blastocatellia bacterium]